MPKKTVRDVPVSGERVLLRADFNVPMEKGVISSDSRIRSTLPTIRYLTQQHARLILCSHLGRPGGKVAEDLRLEPVAKRLAELLHKPVAFVRGCVGPEVAEAVGRLHPGDVLVLENLRFYPGEEKNDPDFARAMASAADLFVQDAFGVVHRAHASTVAITQFLPAVAGFLLERELEMLGRVLDQPQRPLVAVMGGAKISDKIAVLENLVGRVDSLLIGGGMAATFLKALGYEIGKSLIEPDCGPLVAKVLEQAKRRGVRVLLPVDLVVASEFKMDAPSHVVPADGVPRGSCIMDIGPQTREGFRQKLRRCRTVFWNGPMGVFEYPAFAKGTVALAEEMASLTSATTIVGGGSSAEAVEELGLADRMTHVSTGGGAALEYLEGKVLPGVAVLPDKHG